MTFTLPPSPDEIEQARQAELDERMRAAIAADVRKRANLARAQIPELFRRPPAEVLATCLPLLRKQSKMETVAGVIVGPTGCGKTSTVAVLVLRALGEYVRTNGERFACAADLMWTSPLELALARSQHPLGAGEPPEIKRARDCGLLVLDDLGHEPEGAMFVILTARYHGCRPTLTTSNLRLPELSKHLGSPGARRLQQQHVGMPILLVDCHPAAKSKPAGR